jgi:hypothetical protein
MKAVIQKFALISLGSLLCSAGIGRAAEMNLTHVFSPGSVPPGNTNAPWLAYNVQNQGLNSVLFTLTATGNMTDPEKIGLFYFNFDDALTVADLSLTFAGAAGSFSLPGISKGMNALKADGDGFYDLRLSFVTSGGVANYFNSGDSLSYLLTYSGAGTMTETSFEFVSEPGGSEGQYFAAAHIQSTPSGGEGSAWLGATLVTYAAVPEPSTAALVLAGLTMLGLRGRRN